MTSQFIDRLSISNVTQKKVREDQINISFAIGDQTYWMPVTAKQDVFFRPAAVIHVTKKCPYCHNLNPGSHCTLEDLQDELFHRLIDQPSIRLEWLFIPHAGGVK